MVPTTSDMADIVLRTSVLIV